MAGDRILVKDQVTASNNGIYVVQSSGGPIRASDMNLGVPGAAVVWVTNGVKNINTAWLCSTPSATIGSSSINFVRYDVTGTLSVLRGGTNVTTFGGNNTVLYTPTADTLSSIVTANDGVLVTNSSGVPSIGSSLPSTVVGNIDHGLLLPSSLLDDDHPQYALLAGRTGGQNLAGGSAAGDNLILRANSTVTVIGRGTIQLGTTAVPETLQVSTINGILGSVALTIGANTATSVDLGATAIPTNIMGKLQLTPGTGVGTGVDTQIGGILRIGESAATSIQIGGSGKPTLTMGQLQLTSGTGVNAGIDTQTGGVLSVGESTATSIRLGKDTSVVGQLKITPGIGANAGIDIITGEPSNVLRIGETNAGSIQIGKAGILTSVLGDLYVAGTTTSINSTVVNVVDDSLYLNNGYTATSAKNGGIVVNYLPTSVVSSAVTSYDATTAYMANTSTLAVDDLIQVSGANNPSNNGLYRVVSIVANTSITVTGSAPANVNFVQTGFTVDATGGGTIRKVGVSVIRVSTGIAPDVGSAGDWEVGSGNSALNLTYKVMQAGSKWSFNLLQTGVSVSSSATVAYFAWDASNVFGGTAPSSGRISLWMDASGVTTAGATVTLRNVTAGVNLASISIAGNTAAGIFSSALSNIPSSNVSLELQVTKDSSGNPPFLKGVFMVLSQ